MLPVIPQSVNALLQDSKGQLSTYPFPPNVAEMMPKKLRQKIFQWMLQNYIWPQVMERKPYEATWDKLLDMARATWKFSELHIDENTRQANIRSAKILDRKIIEGVPGLEPGDVGVSRRLDVADTVIFDAVDRLTNLNHFITFKESLPVRYEQPEDQETPEENNVYSPTAQLYKSANCWLKFNAANEDVYRKGWLTARHHYTYGVSFVDSQFAQRSEMISRKGADGKWAEVPELTQIGVTFEPMSIRKLWLNYRLNVYKMDYQPCPFFFEELPRFAIIANAYDPMANPMGYVNTSTLPKAEYLFGAPELESLQKVFTTVYPNAQISLQQILAPEYNVELRWTFYPMLPLEIVPNPDDPKQVAFLWDQGEAWLSGTEEMQPPAEGASPTPVSVPLKRYIMETFGNNLINGNQEIIKLQRNFYPNDSLPLYGSAHMPTLDDGAYPSAIGTILEGHYKQICKCIDQMIINKDLNNDPPVDIMTSSPSMSRKDINKAGSRNPVLGPNDIVRRAPFDTTGTTLQTWQYTREQAQTSSKSTDAILGKAMGSRTSATEATNVFTTAMSGVTTDVNLFSHDIYGGYADRVWLYTGRWVDPDILRLITGTFGFAILPEHLNIRLGLKWDTGSQFIESINRQNNIQYMLQSSMGDPTINRAFLWKELLKEWKFKNVDRIVNDAGEGEQIMLATEQAVRTYMGELILVDPAQNHEIALKVKVSFLKDRMSVWNQNPATVIYGPKLVEQIQQHQYWIQIQQMQQQMLMSQQLQAEDPNILQPLQNGQSTPPSAPKTVGQARQNTGK